MNTDFIYVFVCLNFFDGYAVYAGDQFQIFVYLCFSVAIPTEMLKCFFSVDDFAKAIAIRKRIVAIWVVDRMRHENDFSATRHPMGTELSRFVVMAQLQVEALDQALCT